jgi:hypothetical protein
MEEMVRHANLLAECWRFKSVPEFIKLVKDERLVYPVYEPEMLRELHYTYEVIMAAEEAVEAVGDDGTARDRMIYVTTNDDYSYVRLGEGKRDRPPAHLTAALMERCGFSAQQRQLTQRRHWPVPLSLVDAVEANGWRLPWFPLLQKLTKQQAKAGEAALFDQYDLQKNGGLWSNERRS